MDEEKRNELVDRVKFLLEEKFPEAPESDLEISEEGPTEDQVALALEMMAHTAVHVNDKYHRDTMRWLVCKNLEMGGMLCAAERAWLLYVLRKLKDVPHASRGRAILGQEENDLKINLIAFLHKDKIEIPDSAMDERLRRAAENLNCKCAHGYSTVRKMYYSKSYRYFVKMLQEAGHID